MNLDKKADELLPIIQKFLFQILGSVMLMFAPSSVAVAWVSTFFRAFGAGTNYGVANALSADVVEYGEWKTGIRTKGLIFSGANFGGKVLQKFLYACYYYLDRKILVSYTILGLKFKIILAMGYGI